MAKSLAIGVARSASLKSPNWQDLGIVVQSYGGSGEINAIDPALFRDQDGKVYLSYGSFFGGAGWFSASCPAWNPQRGQSHVSGTATSVAKLGRVSCRLAQ